MSMWLCRSICMRRGPAGLLKITPHLSKLCETLATSMIGDIRPISLKVGSDEEVRLPVRPSASA
jgi:hypothetical protein